MPLEGQWARQHAPFLPTARRELRAFAIAGALALAVVGLALWALLAGTQSPASPGCRHETIASTTGGATIEVCGKPQSTDR